MTSSNGRLRQRRCSSADLGVDGAGTNRAWPDTEVSLASVAGADATYWLLTIPPAALARDALTDLLGPGGPLRRSGAGIIDPGVQPAGRAVPVGLAQGTRGRPERHRRGVQPLPRRRTVALDGGSRRDRPGLEPGPRVAIGADPALPDVRRTSPATGRGGCGAARSGGWLPGVRSAPARQPGSRRLLADHAVAGRRYQDPQDDRPRVPGVGRPARAPARIAGESCAGSGRALIRRRFWLTTDHNSTQQLRQEVALSIVSNGSHLRGPSRGPTVASGIAEAMGHVYSR